MKYNWKSFIADLLRLVAALLAGAGGGSMAI